MSQASKAYLWCAVIQLLGGTVMAVGCAVSEPHTGRDWAMCVLGVTLACSGAAQVRLHLRAMRSGDPV